MNNLVKAGMTQKLFTLLFFIGVTFATQAQDKELPPNSTKYTIGEINVTGTTSYNEQTVIAFTNLKTGEQIFIPGTKISKVLNKLWDLGLFSDINIYVTKITGDVVDLEIEIQELPELAETKIRGLKRKKKKEELIKENKLTAGKRVTENLITTTQNRIANSYKEEGYLNAKVKINTVKVEDTLPNSNKVLMVVDVDKGEKVKIDDIQFNGNEALSDAKLSKQLKKTKEKKFWRFWKRSKFIAEEYKSDKASLIKKYKEKGYRDARITNDTIIKKDDNSIVLELDVEEGNRYYFGNISFLGNSVYTDEQLKQIVNVQKGDVYNGTLLEKQVADPTKPDAVDLTNLYQNNGYLFSTINPVETRVYNDTIDFEIRISENKIAYFDHVTVTGNDKTNDNVIYRELRVKPGQKYSKSNVVRTIRELGQLGFFDPEVLEPQFKNVDPNSGTLDMVFPVVEKGSSQIELQGGYGGGGFVGTLGLSFNNFSIRNIFNKEAYKPLPMGDGQQLSVRAQASSFYETYSLSFSEPWLGGKKPVRLSASLSHTVQYFYNAQQRDTDRNRRFLITGGSLGLAKRLRVPDDFFTLSGAISFQHFNLQNYNTGLFTFGDGYSNNLALTVGLSRDNTATNPVFPTSGSQFSVTAKLSPPYSLWNGTDYEALNQQQEDGTLTAAEVDQEKFKWLEYYKIKFNGTWYNRLVGKFVLKTSAEYGFLGAYNSDRGVPPFERFFLGGDGLGGFSLDGRETIALRGYPNQSLVPIDRSSLSQATQNDGATIYNKYSLELRHPITLKPAASIYMLAFAEGGASYDGFRDFNPFQLNRSAGIGLRIFMPAFGLLGIDFGYGFDPIPGTTGSNGWETHFIIGQQF